MTTMVPRVFGDLADWFDIDLSGRSGGLIRVEDAVTDKEYVVRAELPGLKPDRDIQVSAEDGVLTIRAERHEQETGKRRTEFRYGVMQRSVRLPAGADTDHGTASYRDGILQVKVPIAKPKPTAKMIAIAG